MDDEHRLELRVPRLRVDSRELERKGLRTPPVLRRREPRLVLLAWPRVEVTTKRFLELVTDVRHLGVWSFMECDSRAPQAPAGVEYKHTVTAEALAVTGLR